MEDMRDSWETEQLPRSLELARVLKRLGTLHPEIADMLGQLAKDFRELFAARAEIDSLKAALAEAKKDSERLDWLDPHLGELLVYREDDGHRDGPRSYRFINHIGGHATLREAIDAARAAEEEKHD